MDLYKKIKKKFKGKLFSYNDLLEIGGKPAEIYSLVKSEKLERISRGLYQLEDDLMIGLEDQFRAATAQIKSKSAICLLSALSYHDLTTQIIEKHNLLVENKVKTINKNIILFRKRDPKWNVGIEQKEGFKITSIERTIVECAVHKSHVGFEGVQSIRYALRNKKVKLNDLHLMAKKLGYLKKIDSYLEAFI